jgi:hypothetical protein
MKVGNPHLPKPLNKLPGKSLPEVSEPLTLRDGVSTTLSLLGGAVGVVGGLTHNPMLVAAGCGAFALGSGLEAQRVSSSQVDGQFALNVGLGATLVLGGVALLMLTQPATPLSPLQEFLGRFPGLAAL